MMSMEDALALDMSADAESNRSWKVHVCEPEIDVRASLASVSVCITVHAHVKLLRTCEYLSDLKLLHYCRSDLIHSMPMAFLRLLLVLPLSWQACATCLDAGQCGAPTTELNMVEDESMLSVAKSGVLLHGVSDDIRKTDWSFYRLMGVDKIRAQCKKFVTVKIPKALIPKNIELPKEVKNMLKKFIKFIRAIYVERAVKAWVATFTGLEKHKNLNIPSLTTWQSLKANITKIETQKTPKTKRMTAMCFAFRKVFPIFASKHKTNATTAATKTIKAVPAVPAVPAAKTTKAVR